MREIQCAAQTAGLVNEVEDAEVQPPPGALVENPGFHINPEGVVQVGFDVGPGVEDVRPRHMRLRGAEGLGAGIVVPLTDSQLFDVGSAT
ncbi:hypothetical protein [Corynebacterium sp. A21]|uniref:hypothetical protein n=1 Tax=Corynebacterium sp. A21 TaxID=3457318 RepID=UPI003FCFA7AB